MPNYECILCDYNTLIRTHFVKHLTTKKHNLNLIGCDDKLGICENSLISEPFLTLNEPLLTLNEPFLTQNEPFFSENIPFSEKSYKICKFCDKKFGTQSHLTRHKRLNCKAKKDKDIEDKKNGEEIKHLKHQIDKLIDKVGTKTYNTNIGNTLNNNNNNVQLNYFGKENLSMLTDDVKHQLIKGPFKMMSKLMKLVYFNKKYPENHTLKMVNKNKDVIKIHNKNGWELVDKKDTVEYILEDKNYEVDSFYDDNVKEFSQFANKTYINFRKLFDSRDKELWKQIKRDVDLLLWNNM